MSESLDISIICACRNEVGHIREFVDSILNQEMGGMSWEVLIADGMSDDGTRQILDDYCARQARIRVVTNRGRIVSSGLNAAITVSRGNIVLRFDAHTTYEQDYSLRCVEALDRTGATNVGGPARTRASGVKPRAIAAAYHSRFSTGGARFHDPDFEGFVDTVPYGCWRRETFDRIGMFDEALVRNQDDEFNLRLIRSGGTIWQSPAIVSWYSPRSSMRALFHQYFQYGFWKVAVVRKHRFPASWRQLAPAAFVLAHILLVFTLSVTALIGASQEFVWTGAVWLTLAGLYVLGNLAASLLAARKAGWDTFPYLPAAFAAFHFSYGLGFLAALFRLRKQDRDEPSGESVFARITR
jgi:succinoglycan biosynthesis protein ExoA